MKRGNTKLTRWVLASMSVLILMFSIFSVSRVYAFNEGSVLGSSIIVPNYQVYVDGTKVDKPNKVIIVGTNKPTFFGYTVSNVVVNLLIQSNPIKRSTTTDNNGYWVYTLDKTLPAGVHKLFLTLTDSSGASSAATLAATFRVPSVSESSTRTISVPAPSLEKLDYFTVSLLSPVVVVLVLLYLLAKRAEAC